MAAPFMFIVHTACCDITLTLHRGGPAIIPRSPGTTLLWSGQGGITPALPVPQLFLICFFFLSFTWSAARTDRNVISVLSGQVVEAFDKQFQELYLMSRGVSLKSIPMDEEPEPEPVILPSIIPMSPDTTVVKKMVNPKYALVKAKSADQITSPQNVSQNITDQQRAEAKDKAIPEGQASEQPSDLIEMVPPIHPGLLNLEKANMFDYLPTWVEPDPEPGSEVLGYINIIDPKIKNIQLSQMNRIKVCDVSQANAQHRQMLKKKAQEEKRRQDNQPVPIPPHQSDVPSSTTQLQEVPKATTSPTEKTHRTHQSKGPFATLADSQHLKQPPEEEVHEREQVENIVPPVPKPRTVHVTNFIKNVNVESGLAGVEDTPTEQLEMDGSNTTHNEKPMKVQDTRNHQKTKRQRSLSREAASYPVNGLQEGEAEEEEEEDFITLSDHESLSGSSASHSHHHSDASSISDEYFEVRDRCRPLQRTNSDFLLNGGHYPLLQRKLSEPFMSRGTFVSPLGSPQPPMLGMGLEEAYQRRRHSDSVEDIRCLLGKGRNPHAFPGGYITCSSSAPQVGLLL